MKDVEVLRESEENFRTLAEKLQNQEVVQVWSILGMEIRKAKTSVKALTSLLKIRND